MCKIKLQQSQLLEIREIVRKLSIYNTRNKITAVIYKAVLVRCHISEKNCNYMKVIIVRVIILRYTATLTKSF